MTGIATWRRRVAAILLALALLPAFSPAAQAWWNSDWSNRMKVNADAGPKGANIVEPIGRTQILVRLHSGNFNFETAKDDGSDLRVIAADDRTPLHYHIERYDGLIDQVALIWIDLADLAPGTATAFYLYWGNKNATNGSDAKGTYDPDQLLVYHFADDNGLPHDTTGYANNAQTAGKRDDGGMIGFGLKLDGKSPIRIPASPSLAMPAGQAMTWSMWVRTPDATTTGVLYSARDGAAAVTIGLDQGVAYAQIETPAGVVRTPPGAGLAGEAWHHVAVTVADKLSVFVDGEARGQVAGSLPAMNAPSQLGAAMMAEIAAPAPAAAPASGPASASAPPPAPAPAPAPAAGSAAPASPADAAAPPAPDAAAAPAPGFAGLIDEFQISRNVRPTGAFQAAVHSQGPQANLIAFDVAEQASALGNGYLAIILRSVTPDAWVVIGILGVMSLISWIVMVGKAIYITRVASANRVFRQDFRAVLKRASAAGGSFEPMSAARHPALARAPLFRLYEVAARELQERLAVGRVGPDGRIAPQSLAAIRSAIEAGLSQETTRLNRLMVLLTIAISGGPFLGLLGTVVGVMITFAAIAAAGDVNVNSIAPGISAALLATVAGLAVAIPALFGYNYFLTRIRDVTVEMQVFVDEIITRIGEGVRTPPSPGAVSRAPARDPDQRAAAE